jgi:predicted RNA binding protein YcfA (HicA-like mRNA interferase family)
MAPQFDRPLRELLSAAGCTLVRQGKGSHEIWHSPITKRNFAVPVGIPSRHTANAILRQAGLPKAFLTLVCGLTAPASPMFALISLRSPRRMQIAAA